MNIIVGLKSNPRELTLDVELSEEELFAQVRESLTQNTPLLLADSKGQRTLIPAHALSFVQVSSEQPRRVGVARC